MIEPRTLSEVGVIGYMMPLREVVTVATVITAEISAPLEPEEIPIAITADGTADVRYTVDGSDPGPGVGYLLDAVGAPIRVTYYDVAEVKLWTPGIPDVDDEPGPIVSVRAVRGATRKELVNRVVTGSLIRTAENGPRIEIDGLGQTISFFSGLDVEESPGVISVAALQPIPDSPETDKSYLVLTAPTTTGVTPAGMSIESGAIDTDFAPSRIAMAAATYEVDGHLRNTDLGFNWHAMTGLTASWQNIGIGDTLEYIKDAAGMVHMRGRITGGTPGTFSNFFDLPDGYRPTRKIQMPTVTVGATAAQIDVDTLGQLNVTAAGAGYTPGSATTTNWISVCLSFSTL